jgi:glycosyltransferase involved in cell wall biosynthesis
MLGGGVRDRGPHRVFFVTASAEWTGPNVSMVELVTRLPGWIEPVVAVVGEGTLIGALRERRIRIERFARLDKYGIPSLAVRLRRTGAALVYGNSASGVSKNALIAARLTGLPFVIHLREMAGRAGWRKVRFLRFADAVIAVSEATAASYAPYVREPPIVIHNGVPLDRFEPPPPARSERVRAELGIPVAAPVVVHVGNVTRRKDQLRAVDAVRETWRSSLETHLLIVGRHDREPSYVQRLREHVAAVEHPERIHLAGLRRDVPALLFASDIFLHTALQDPHPRAVIEAMAAGLPVVAIGVDGVTETVNDGETGFVLDVSASSAGLASRVAELAEDPELRRKLGEAGRRRAERKFSAEATAERVAHVIENVLASEGTGRPLSRKETR